MSSFYVKWCVLVFGVVILEVFHVADRFEIGAKRHFHSINVFLPQFFLFLFFLFSQPGFTRFFGQLVDPFDFRV